MCYVCAFIYGLKKEDLLKLNQELSDKIQQFVAFIDKFYNPKKLTKTFQEFYRHRVKDILAELEKQEVRTRIPKQSNLSTFSIISKMK